MKHRSKSAFSSLGYLVHPRKPVNLCVIPTQALYFFVIIRHSVAEKIVLADGQTILTVYIRGHNIEHCDGGSHYGIAFGKGAVNIALALATLLLNYLFEIAAIILFHVGFIL